MKLNRRGFFQTVAAGVFGFFLPKNELPEITEPIVPSSVCGDYVEMTGMTKTTFLTTSKGSDASLITKILIGTTSTDSKWITWHPIKVEDLHNE